MTNSREWDRESRDLLISLDTKVQSILLELQDLKGNYSNRLLNLEGNAVTKIEFDDHETRIRFIERWTWGAIAVLAVAELILNVLSNNGFHL